MYLFSSFDSYLFTQALIIKIITRQAQESANKMMLRITMIKHILMACNRIRRDVHRLFLKHDYLYLLNI